MQINNEEIREEGCSDSNRSKDQLMIDSRVNENGESYKNRKKIRRKHLNQKNLNNRINLNIIQNI